ncbi:MAG: RNA polymerase sigma factor [Oscillospiraceae bacterium]|nr:RNA polymerase sigma factor [Oscillospiraceae bacterium]
MENLSFRPDDNDVENTVKTYSNMLFKLCFTLLRNNADAEDAVSDVFLKYISTSISFTDEEHKKAWLIRVATNICKNTIKFRKVRNHINLDDAAEYCKSDNDIGIFTELLNLPAKYRTVIHLYYVEGYKTSEIADILSVSPAAVRKRLQYGRDMLKIEYGKDVLL